MSFPYDDVRQRAGEARRLLQARNWEAAGAVLEAALAEHPQSAVLLALAAELYRRTKKLAEAKVFLERAESADPGHELVLSGAADLAFDERDYEKAAGYYEQLLDRKPSRYHLSRLVQAYSRLGRHDEAGDRARQGLERYPEDPWLLRGLAASEAKQGRREEAVRLYEQLIALDPQDRFAYKELMRLRTEGAPADQAAAELKGLMRSGDRSKNPHLRTLAADRLRKAGKLTEAVAEYAAALALAPGNAYALSQLGFCYRRLGRVDEAMETLGKAFLADPASPYVRKSLEALCKKSGRLSRLASLVEEALRLHPEVKSLYGFRKRLARLSAQDEGA